ncbi:hypothetical protein PIB30_063196 [Stylosanthes scabra]|uniref:Uncharacterized protein n=1 Tax=Stylosanthes scabra TaxID=79078 RepID=A0ABU6UKE8_9FABA|nr:hypothetical protein [Stylosanthes scabra]
MKKEGCKLKLTKSKYRRGETTKETPREVWKWERKTVQPKNVSNGPGFNHNTDGRRSYKEALEGTADRVILVAVNPENGMLSIGDSKVYLKGIADVSRHLERTLIGETSGVPEN